MADKNDIEMLCRCSKRGNLPALTRVLTEGGHAMINDKDFKGMTALHWAAVKGHLDIVQYLIQNKADIDVKNDKAGETALHMSTRKGCAPVVKYLVQEGADLNIKDNQGLTALDICSGKKHLEDIARCLQQNGATSNQNDTEESNSDAAGVAKLKDKVAILENAVETAFRDGFKAGYKEGCQEANMSNS
eukprot:TRINITY_DN14072_c0_g1_i3.p1 TRINITY_DN14072_c0_g1~~TRINITY_DN14072_c0_g1_i3.p1  ORF type:complete len:189 (-),score=27.59 TRINITY_DN14072_c0_g1_i3:91-657(-)